MQLQQNTKPCRQHDGLGRNGALLSNENAEHLFWGEGLRRQDCRESQCHSSDPVTSRANRQAPTRHNFRTTGKLQAHPLRCASGKRLEDDASTKAVYRLWTACGQEPSVGNGETAA